MIKLKTLFGVLFFVCIGYEFTDAQQRSVPVSQQFRLGEGLIRIAEPGQLADSVSVWGDINTPGRYLIPRGTRIHELISYARGPASYRTGDTTVDWSKLRIEINITSFGESNEEPVFTNFTYRYSDPIPDRFYDHTLKNSDIIGVEVKRRPSFADYVRVIGPAVSAIATTFIIIDRL